MTYEDLLRRISIDPKICHGKPCIHGHRIWVSLIMDLMADGMTTDYLPADYASARRIINGTDKAKTIAGYAQHFEAAMVQKM